MTSLPTRFAKQKPSEFRHKVAREAASLLYSGIEKEFFQAKTKAAENLGSRILPSNLEVAMELEKLAEETEGAIRANRLIEMRKDALEIMKLLNEYHPALIGSVWRGTIKPASDIDIEVYCNEPKRVVDSLRARKIGIENIQISKVTEKGKSSTSSHIFTETASKFRAEITVRSLTEKGKKRKCDIFGDEIKGLTIKELENVLAQNPCQKFLPR